MNTLKFKFWNKKENRFTRTVASSHYDYYIHISDSGGLIGVNPNGIQDPVIDLDDDDFEILQFMGMKDRNNNDIYDRDIILDPTANGGKYKVVKQREDGQWILEYKTPEIKDEDFTYYDDLFSRINYCEVVGNAFENGDLMK